MLIDLLSVLSLRFLRFVRKAGKSGEKGRTNIEQLYIIIKLVFIKESTGFGQQTEGI